MQNVQYIRNFYRHPSQYETFKNPRFCDIAFSRSKWPNINLKKRAVFITFFRKFAPFHGELFLGGHVLCPQNITQMQRFITWAHTFTQTTHEGKTRQSDKKTNKAKAGETKRGTVRKAKKQKGVHTNIHSEKQMKAKYTNGRLSETQTHLKTNNQTVKRENTQTNKETKPIKNKTHAQTKKHEGKTKYGET